MIGILLKIVAQKINKNNAICTSLSTNKVRCSLQVGVFPTTACVKFTCTLAPGSYIMNHLFNTSQKQIPILISFHLYRPKAHITNELEKGKASEYYPTYIISSYVTSLRL